MSSEDFAGPDPRAASEPGDAAGSTPLTPWKKLRLVIRVIELRLRFIVLMAGTGLTFAYWDTLWNRYDMWMRPAETSVAVVAGIEFFCPMHPQVTQDHPGSCPICGMPLAKRKKGEKPSLPAGVTARIELSPDRVGQAGIRTVDVGYAPLARKLTTVGNVAFDERRLANIIAKAPGATRVETLYVNVTGQEVKAGQPLAELYSPELSQAVRELLTVARRAPVSARPETETTRALQTDRLERVRASTEKLMRWGITRAQVDKVIATGQGDVTLPILSPIAGHVVRKNVVEGQEVPQGFAMFEVADLNAVWVRAQVYEHQLGLIRVGQTVEATVEAFPGELFAGRVEFLQPSLDPETRTLEVRFALENPGHRLRPGMFATVTLAAPIAETPEFQGKLAAHPTSGDRERRVSLTAEEQKTCPVTHLKLGSMGDPIAVDVEARRVWTCCEACSPKLKAQPARYLARLDPPPHGEVLSVPESAVIDTGRRKVVYVEPEPGVFEGREVVLGPRIGDRFPVLEGLAPGEKVAAAGAFLIDAESRLNPVAPPSTDHVPTSHEAPVSKSAAVSTETTHRH